MEEVFSPDASRSILANIASSVAEIFGREFCVRKSGDSTGDAVGRLLSEIAADPCADWDREVQARRLSVSPRTLDNHCMARFACSYSKFLRDCRMDFALRLIRKGAKNSEIARLVGYSDAYSFSKAVRAHFGKSPRELKAGIPDA